MRTPSLVSAMGLGRALDGGNYFEDNGSAYGLSWRYLGLFMDCDVEAVEQRRRLDDNNDCSRKVLWAAVSVCTSVAMYHCCNVSFCHETLAVPRSVL